VQLGVERALERRKLVFNIARRGGLEGGVRRLALGFEVSVIAVIGAVTETPHAG